MISFCKLLGLVLNTFAITVKVKRSVLTFWMPKAREPARKERGRGLDPSLRVDPFGQFPHPH